ncbi:type II toxin-antitoxin system RelB/DinJ family antitoxin [Selenomonas sputigena]|uniref:type II toxin-antitoxin system RelB/DinJ family antitoxin n=1 Tax=Selenomonas sputigena TaxID=69823 RepID=UPI0022311F3B|nr:type II toxin-antitoxin system RelB/DinJ family antitoxin [Selenomonas sputigena]UZD44044.1 type II toxin-antitoxin system RelB/DinJ family antitoxin [Selenomonas sputigena]
MAQICLSIDDDVKREAEQVCEDMGMSMSTAVNIYLKRLGRERRIPFEVMAEPFWSSENAAILDRRIADIRAGRNVSEHELIEV